LAKAELKNKTKLSIQRHNKQIKRPTTIKRQRALVALDVHSRRFQREFTRR
jgi:hypothetical protein